MRPVSKQSRIYAHARTVFFSRASRNHLMPYLAPRAATRASPPPLLFLSRSRVYPSFPLPFAPSRSWHFVPLSLPILLCLSFFCLYRLPFPPRSLYYAVISFLKAFNARVVTPWIVEKASRSGASDARASSR